VDVGPVNDACVAALAARTGETVETLRFLTAEVTRPGGDWAIPPPYALENGWADRVGTLEDARQLAADLAAGATPEPTVRSRRLRGAPPVPVDVRALVDSVAAHQTQSSESTFTGTLTISPSERAHQLALVNWTVRTAPNATYKGIASNGSRIVMAGAAGAGSGLATSDDDGSTWTDVTSAWGSQKQDVAWNGTVFCVIMDSLAGVGRTSTDGGTWTARTLPANIVWRYVVAAGTTLVIFGNAQTGTAGEFVSRSTDNGATWSAAARIGTTYLGADNGRMAVAGQTIIAARRQLTGAALTCWRSTNGGQNWGTVTIDAATAAADTNVTAWADGTSFVVLRSTANGADIFQSTDGGATWSSVGVAPVDGFLVWTGLVWLLYLAGWASSGKIWRVYLSSDLRLWVERNAVESTASRWCGLWTGTRVIIGGYSSGAAGSSAGVSQSNAI